ncbi:hypothetical protein Dimus_036306 [Dionaea muscipula]
MVTWYQLSVEDIDGISIAVDEAAFDDGFGVDNVFSRQSIEEREGSLAVDGLERSLIGQMWQSSEGRVVGGSVASRGGEGWPLGVASNVSGSHGGPGFRSFASVVGSNRRSNVEILFFPPCLADRRANVVMEESDSGEDE